MSTISSFAQPPLRLQSLTRKFTDNSEWILKTNKGDARLVNVYSDGSEWQLTFKDGSTYTFKQAYTNDWTEWKTLSGKQVLYTTLSFKNDFSEWRSGNPDDFVYTKTIFSNSYNEWAISGKGGKMTLKSTFNDKGTWKMEDELGTDDITKLSCVFVSFITSVILKK